MNVIRAIAWREIKSYFNSPVAYIVIAGFMLVMGIIFFNTLAGYLYQAMQYKTMQFNREQNLNDGVLRPLYANINFMFLISIPLITMRLFAEEKKNHTIELLMTSPVTLIQMVAGKYLASLFLLCVILGVCLFYPGILLYAGNPDPGSILTSNLANLLLGACYLSLGIFFSATTENQIIAAALTFFGILLFWIVGWAAQSVGGVGGEILQHLALISHFYNFTGGSIQTTGVVYYLSYIFFFLFLTVRILDSHRWR